MQSLAFIGLGLGFLLMGGGLWALTCRKPAKPLPAQPTKAQQREQSALAEENKKMRIAAGTIAGFGVLLLLVSLL